MPEIQAKKVDSYLKQNVFAHAYLRDAHINRFTLASF